MKKKISFLMFLVFSIIYLITNSNISAYSIFEFVLVELFLSFWAILFSILPLSSLFDKDGSKNLSTKLITSRIIIILLSVFLIPTDIIILGDFLVNFIFAFIVLILVIITSYKSIKSKINNKMNSIESDTIENSEDIKEVNITIPKDKSPIVSFDKTYEQNEKIILRNLIIEELKLQGENEKKFTTISLNKKKNILLTFLGITTFIFTLMFYFNYSLLFCLSLESISLFIYYSIDERFNTLNVLTKQAIENPNEDISILIKKMQKEKYDFPISNRFKFIIISFIVIIPTLYFLEPRIIYIKYSDGYSVFRYTRGIITSSVVNIPDTYKGKQVLSIGENAFMNSNIETVNLPNGLKSINTKAFINAKNLKKIEIPSTVEEIRKSAFENCTSLTDVVLHEGLKEIRASVFKNDINLVNIELPNSLEYLGAGAFSYCSSLIEITIPKNVTEINGQTFEYCTSLKTVNLHNDIISIHGEVFIGDYSLVNITLPSKITEVRGSTFEGCRSLTKITIPEGVTRIGGHAFYGCTNLSYVSIPSTVTEIGSSAFRQCSSLYNVKIPYGAYINERAFKESPTSIQRY